MYPLLYVAKITPKKTRVLKHNPYEEDCSHYHHSCSDAWRALRSELRTSSV